MGFRRVWYVDREYEIKNGVLRPVDPDPNNSGFRRVYAPAVEPGLLEELAVVSDESTLLKFAKRFGLLGFSHIVPPDKRVGGDPVDWALARAREVNVVLELQSLLEDVQETERDTTLRKELPELMREAQVPLLSFSVDEVCDLTAEEKEKFIGASFGKPGWIWTAAWPNSPVRAAWECLANLINPLVRRIRFEVRPADEVEGPNLALRFDALIDVIGWRLATQLGRLKPYLCKQCGRFGFAKRSSKQTCSSECRKDWWRKHGKYRSE